MNRKLSTAPEFYFGYCQISALATADPRHDFDSGRVEQRRRYDHRLENGYRAIWFHAVEPHGLGWADPGLSIDDDYCRFTDTWLALSKCEEMECGWSTTLDQHRSSEQWPSAPRQPAVRFPG